MELGCVVMACGQGRRFTAAGGDGDKLLADLAGMPLIVHTVASVPSDIYEVVLSVRSQWVGAAVGLASLSAAPVYHGAAYPPRSIALRRALAYGIDRWDGCLFLPGDQPLVSDASFRALADAFAADPTRAYRLSWQGTPGSPVLFPRSCFSALMALTGSEGGGEVLRRGNVPVSLVEARDAAELWDIDTPEDLDRAARYLVGE